MDYRRLRYFVVCAEELHFTRAARRLGIAQPPLSQQIQVLEKEMGVRLFHRLSRGVELTPAGQSFLQNARSILDMTERAIVSAQQIARGERGSIRIGFTSSAAFNPFVPNIISAFRARHEHMDVSLAENTTSTTLEHLRDGRLDIAFLRPASAEREGFKVRRLFDEPMLVALPPGHRLASEAIVDMAALAGEDFILYPRKNGQALYDAIISSCQNAGFSPNIVQEAPQLASAITLVASGIGLALVPASMNRLQAEGVSYKPLCGPAPQATLSLVTSEGPLSAAAQEFHDQVVRHAAKLQNGQA